MTISISGGRRSHMENYNVRTSGCNAVSESFAKLLKPFRPWHGPPQQMVPLNSSMVAGWLTLASRRIKRWVGARQLRFIRMISTYLWITGEPLWLQASQVKSKRAFVVSTEYTAGFCSARIHPSTTTEGAPNGTEQIPISKSAKEQSRPSGRAKLIWRKRRG